MKPRDMLEEYLLSGLHVKEPQNDLNDTHESRLLESTFALEKRAQNETSYEDSGQSLLTELYNTAFKQKFHTHLSSASRAGESSPLSGMAPKLSMRLWSKTITGGRGGSLRLVYWLVLQSSNPAAISSPSTSSDDNNDQRALPYKVLSADEANELIDLLDHAFIQQAIDNRPLIRPIVLVAPYRRPVRTQVSGEPPADTSDDLLSIRVPSPHVIDDSLAVPAATSPNGNQQQQQQRPQLATADQSSLQNNAPASSLQLFVDKLFKSSFNDNLHLYLIVFISILLLIVLCFAIPMICSKLILNQSATKSRTITLPQTATASTTSGRHNGNGSGTNSSSTSHSKRTRAGSHTSGGGGGGGGGGNLSRRHNSGATRYSGAEPQVATPTDQKVSGAAGLLHNRRDQAAALSSYFDADTNEHDTNYNGRLQAISGTINEAVWTKLSNSTTTLTKDRTRTMYDDGQVCVPILRHNQDYLDREQLEQQLQQQQQQQDKLKRSEWYTFEDKIQTTKTTSATSRRNNNGQSSPVTRDKHSQTITANDHYKLTKSVQTNNELDNDDHDHGDYDEAQLDDRGAAVATLRAGDQRLMNMNMSFKDRIETRNSDTLTKSELVMLKEKLIPIGRQQAMGTVDLEPPSRATTHDYVNTPIACNQQKQQQATRFIDSSIDSTNGLQTRAPSGSLAGLGATQKSITTAAGAAAGPSRETGRSSQIDQRPDLDQRTPKMRYLELPSKAQVKVDEIKGELSRVEARDGNNRQQQQQQQAMTTGTYKRYDVI